MRTTEISAMYRASSIAFIYFFLGNIENRGGTVVSTNATAEEETWRGEQANLKVMSPGIRRRHWCDAEKKSFTALKNEAAAVGLQLNIPKTKYMTMDNKPGNWSTIKLAGENIGVVQSFFAEG